MNRDFAATIARAFRRVAVPLAAYYTVTVAVPLANGAAQSGAAFVRHALVVLMVPLVLLVVLCAVRGGAARAISLCERGRSTDRTP